MKNLIKNNLKSIKTAGITIVALIMIAIVFFSPSLVSKLMGNVNSIDTSSNEQIKTGVVIDSNILFNSDTNDIKIKIYNGSKNSISINKIIWRDSCSDNCEGIVTNLIDLDSTINVGIDSEEEINVNDSSINSVMLEDYKKIDVGVQYSLDQKIYNIFLPITNINKINGSTLNEIDEEKTEETFTIKNYHNAEGSDDIIINISDNDIHMDISEDLSKLNLVFKYQSSFGNKWNYASPSRPDTYGANIIGQANSVITNMQTYFNLTDDKVVDGSGTFTLESGTVQFTFKGTAKDLMTDQNIIPSLYGKQYKTGIGSYNRDTGNTSHFYVDGYSDSLTNDEKIALIKEKIPHFKATVYDKSSVEEAINGTNGALNKLISLSEEIKEDSILGYYNLIKNAKELYNSRDTYNSCDINNNCVKKDVNQEEINRIVNELNNYSFEKKSSADYTAYNNLLNEISLIKEEWYPTSDYENFLLVYNEKDNYLNLTESYQIKLDNYVERLQIALDNLNAALYSANYETFDSLIADLKAKENKITINDKDYQYYTSASWEEFQNIINQEYNHELKIKDQEIVDGYCDTLRNSTNVLVEESANYDVINQAISDYRNTESYLNDYWTLESKKNVEDYILTMPENKLISEQAQIDAWCAELLNKISSLELKKALGYYDSDNYHLSSIPESLSIEGYLSLFKDRISTKIGDRNLYTDSTINATNNIISKYKDENGNWKSDLEYIKINNQAAMDEVIADLENYKNTGFEKNLADYTALNTALDKASKLNRSWYVSLTDLDEKIAAAKAVKEYTIDKQAEVDSAASALEAAISGLVLKPADYTNINDFIENTYNNLDSSKYTNFETLSNIVDTYNKNLTIDKQDDVKAIYNSLINAYDGLKKTRADYTKLDLAVSNAHNYNPNNYTNYDHLQELLDSVNNDLDWSYQDEIDDLADEIEKAISKLNKVLADYSKLNNTVSRLPKDYSSYPENVQKEIVEYLNEVKELSNDLRFDEQEIIDEIVDRGSKLLEVISKYDEYNKELLEAEKLEAEKVENKKNNKPSITNQAPSVTQQYYALSSKVELVEFIKINDKKVDIRKDNQKIKVRFRIKKAELDIKLSSDELKYEIYGGEVLLPGENTVTIIVTTKDNKKYKYDVIIERPETSNYLEELAIKDNDIDFDSEKTEYTIHVKRNVKKLNLKTVSEDENATIEIIGNEDLKNNSKVKVRVTDTKGNVKDYVITVKKASAAPLVISLITMSLLGLSFGVKEFVRKRNLI